MTITPQVLAIIGGVVAEIGALIGSVSGCLKTGGAGAPTLAEDPSQFRNVLVLAAAPLTQSFYAMIVMLTIFTLVVPKLAADSPMGWAVLGIGFLVGNAEFFSAWFQGEVCAAGISVLPKSKGLVFTPTILMAAYLELIGILGMVFAIMSFALLGLM